MTNSPFILSIELVDGPAYQHGYHLGTIESVARHEVEVRFRGMSHGKVRTMALMRDGRVFDVFDGQWHSAMFDAALERAADEAAYEDSFRDSDPVHMTPAMRAVAAAHEPDFEELQSAYEDLRDREAAVRGYEDERRRKGGWSLRAAAARIASSDDEYPG